MIQTPSPAEQVFPVPVKVILGWPEFLFIRGEHTNAAQGTPVPVKGNNGSAETTVP